MIDKVVQGLNERAIDSPLKLQLLLLYCEHRRFEGTPIEIAQRIYRDIWSTAEALRELADDGILVCATKNGEPTYRYNPHADLNDSIARLCQMYNEPIERDSLQRLVRDVATYAPYRRGGSRTIDAERYSFAVLHVTTACCRRNTTPPRFFLGGVVLWYDCCTPGQRSIAGMVRRTKREAVPGAQKSVGACACLTHFVKSMIRPRPRYKTAFRLASI